MQEQFFQRISGGLCRSSFTFRHQVIDSIRWIDSSDSHVDSRILQAHCNSMAQPNSHIISNRTHQVRWLSMRAPD